MTPPMFRIERGAVGAERVRLTGSEGHHAADVKRLRVGEQIWVTDGSGVRGVGAVHAVARGVLEVGVGEWIREAAATPRLVAVQALAKGGRDEAAVEAMTEVGVDEIVAWAASRSIAKWTDRTAAKWQSTADAAAKQARRSWWPEVAGPATTADVAKRISAASVAMVLHESATGSPADVDLVGASEVLVVVGPEGGITDDELEQMAMAGACAVRLGGNVLRSSTAGVAALSAICARTRWA